MKKGTQRRLIAMVMAMVLVFTPFVTTASPENDVLVIDDYSYYDESPLDNYIIEFMPGHFPSEFIVSEGETDIVFDMSVIISVREDDEVELPEYPLPGYPEEDLVDDSDEYPVEEAEDDPEVDISDREPED